MFLPIASRIQRCWLPPYKSRQSLLSGVCIVWNAWTFAGAFQRPNPCSMRHRRNLLYAPLHHLDPGCWRTSLNSLKGAFCCCPPDKTMVGWCWPIGCFCCPCRIKWGFHVELCGCFDVLLHLRTLWALSRRLGHLRHKDGHHMPRCLRYPDGNLPPSLSTGKYFAIWDSCQPCLFSEYWVKVVTYAAVIFLCRKRCAVGKSMIYMSFLLDESIVCGIDFSNILQGHTCFWDIFFLR